MSLPRVQLQPAPRRREPHYDLVTLVLTSLLFVYCTGVVLLALVAAVSR